MDCDLQQIAVRERFLITLNTPSVKNTDIICSLE